MRTPALVLLSTLGVLSALALPATGARAGGVVTPLPAQGTWTQTLHARDLQGHAVALDDAAAVFFFDSTLNVTWLRQPAPAAGTLNQARAWADALVVGAWSDWRLPRTLDTAHAGCTLVTYQGGDCGYNVPTQVGAAYSEMAHLFHVTLGNAAAYTPDGEFRGWVGQGTQWGLANTARFEGLQWAPYWSGNAIAGAPAYGWSFDLGTGLQLPLEGGQPRQAMALRDGDVLSAVPEPSSLSLGALGVVALLARRRLRRGALRD